MKEIGGYIEMEHYNLPMLHDRAIALNCGRNCLAYLIRAKEIKKILLPKYICDSVINVCQREHVAIRYYSINEKFLPERIYLQEEEWLYLINYYGQLTNCEIEDFYNKYNRIIVDQSQAYFQMPVEAVDTLYSCRKFLGVPDGGFLYTTGIWKQKLIQDESYQRVNFLLGRYEKTASEFYDEYVANNYFFENESIKKMSKLTRNLLHSFDYERIKNVRTMNYNYLFQRLQKQNFLKLRKNIVGAFMYPLYIKDGDRIRKTLQRKMVYIPTLWPDVFRTCSENDLEYQLSKNILPIPCDQRYGIEEMEYMVKLIELSL